jgi:hypothetical protein
MWLKVPSRAMVCRGPASNDQVTVSVPPSGWHDQQPPQPRSDQNGREVKKSILPRRMVSSIEPLADRIRVLGCGARRGFVFFVETDAT